MRTERDSAEVLGMCLRSTVAAFCRRMSGVKHYNILVVIPVVSGVLTRSGLLL